MSAATFRSLHGVLSNPVAFLTFSFLRRLRTSPTVAILSENVLVLPVGFKVALGLNISGWYFCG